MQAETERDDMSAKYNSLLDIINKSNKVLKVSENGEIGQKLENKLKKQNSIKDKRKTKDTDQVNEYFVFFFMYVVLVLLVLSNI